jgi:hypothetical protein
MAYFSRTPEPEQPNAIVGAARRINLRRRDEVENIRDRSTEEWQKLAWRHYDIIGEIKFAFNYFAAIASRVRMYAGYQSDDADSPAFIGSIGNLDRSFVNAAKHEMSKLNAGRGGQPNLIRSAVLNLLVAGECYLVGHAGSWNIRSTSELVFEQDGRVRLRLSKHERKNTGNYLPDNAFIARIWRTHPEYSDDSDSSLKGVEEPCQELLLMSRIIKVSGQSRLNAGILYVADELRFQRSVDPSGETSVPDVDPFEEELMMTLTDPVNGESPSDIMPMIIRGPAALSKDAIIHLDLGREFDSTILDRHEKTLTRILDGIDLPKDLVQGLANVRYSNARTISEDLLKAHIEPMMVILCEALTTVYLRPALLERGYDRDLVDRVHVWYDASEVVTRPDRSEDADAGHDRGVISDSAWRRAHGFSEADAPTDEETALRIALKGQVTPDITLEFLRKIAPELVAEAERLTKEAGLPVATGDSGGASPNPQPRSTPQRNMPGHIIAPPTRTPARQEAPEGALPGRENSARDDQVLKLLTNFANTTRKNSVVATRTRKLERALDVERRLRESMAVHMNDVVSRALEKAGARAVSKVRGDAELKALVASVPMEEVFATIPEDRRGEYGLNDERKLVQDAIEKARPTFEAMIRDAQDSGWKSLGILDKMKPLQESNLVKAWAHLASKLMDLTVGWLRKPKTQGLYVDMGLIREVTAIAGGAPVTHQEPIDSGRAVLSRQALDATEWELSDRYRWVHGISEDIFEPHLMLDDTVFDSWEAAELATPDPNQFPFVKHYYPGDHKGCRCDWLPEVLDPTKVNEPTKGNTAFDRDPLLEAAR